MTNGVQYQPVSPDPAKSCNKCKHFKPKKEGADAGDCFGYKVKAEGTCKLFEAKEE